MAEDEIKMVMMDVPCSRCGKKPADCTCAPEELKDIKGSEHMEHEWGDERFRGWYLTKAEKSCESQPLGYEDQTYELKVADYNYQFFMPSIIEFTNGIITYSEGERRLGVFRYPKGPDGGYMSPVTSLSQDKIDGLLQLPEEELKELLTNSEVLTFEAFRIPQFGF